MCLHLETAPRLYATWLLYTRNAEIHGSPFFVREGLEYPTTGLDAVWPKTTLILLPCLPPPLPLMLDYS